MILRILFFIFFLCPMVAMAQSNGSIHDIRIHHTADKTRLVIDLSGDYAFQARLSDNPNQLIISLRQRPWETSLQAKAKPPFASITPSQPTSDIMQMAFTLDQPHIIETAFLLPQSSQTPYHRLVIDLTAASQPEFMHHLAQIHGPLDVPVSTGSLDQLIASITTAKPSLTPTDAAPDIPEKKPQQRIKKRIVIDAGHGGKDPGAISPSGIFEKNITLSMAKTIATILNQSGRYDARLTRTKDHFIRLYDRVKIARNADADLFISVHADSVGNSHTRGASVYTLSNKASDAQSAKLAARENRADLIGGIDLNIEDEDISAILIDLSMRETMNQSKKLANNVVEGLRNHNVSTLSGPHRYAGFAVLKAPDVPSILIETGFVSNEREAKQLLDPSYQKKIAQAILKSLDHYFTQ